MQRAYRLLYLLALLKLILPFLLQNGAYEPHRDELLYLAEAQHMAWGFMEVPPLLSVFAWLTQAFGGSMFWIKFWPALFGALTWLLTGKLILTLGGKRFALLLGWLPFFFGVYLRIHLLFQPNFLEIFFWTGMAYGLVRYAQSNDTGFLYQAGISLGLGMMSKYSVSFYALGLMGGLLLTWNRAVLLNRHFYFALAIAFLIFLPNLVWQWVHGFPVVYHMRELERTQLQYVSRADFLSGQLLLNISCVFTWIAGLLWAGFAKEGKPYRFIGWATLITIGLLTFEHAKNYYSMGAYPVLFAFGAYAIETWTAKGWKQVFRYALVAATLVMGYAIVPIALPVLPPRALADYYARTGIAGKLGALKWEDLENHPLPQDFSDMLGWREITAKTAKAYNSLDSAEKSNTLIFCDNYGMAGALSYYGPQYHLPPSYSDNASFLYWIPDSVADSRGNMEVIVLVSDNPHEMELPYIREFQSAVLVDSVTNPFAREKGDVIVVLKKPNDLFKEQWKQKMEHDKEKATARGASGKSPI